MSSRRTLLACLSTIGLASVSGCLSMVGLRKRGYIQWKWISVEHEHEDGQLHSEKVLDASLSHPVERGAIDSWVAEEYAEFVDDTDYPVVSESFHRALARQNKRVNYGIGVCGSDFASRDERSGCLNTWTSREDFNRVQVYDRVEVSEDDGRFDVHRVTGGETLTPRP
ncbi:hypothetical protein SAMN04487950_2394 [Halogranum rubrum]|uniref:Lipoprotein n=1 Tax=Halogranum rubrum TaxID=553466 RepID=A0A1I4EV62_9EURY|nr:hypothetical protein [Halogranum rubrum]SFL09083.1 hypothetical protein SAMN04487950_2394 [Halogranum rubrum]